MRYFINANFASEFACVLFGMPFLGAHDLFGGSLRCCTF